MAYQSHLPILKQSIESFNIKSVFEFGIGIYSTDLFLKNCDSGIMSIEMNDHKHEGRSWYDYTVSELSSHNNSCRWRHKQIVGEFFAIHYAMGIFHNEKFDLVFVDGHGDSRGEQVNSVFCEQDPAAKIIIAHDTEHMKQRNKWRIPDSYGIMDFHNGPITTVITTTEMLNAVKEWEGGSDNPRWITNNN